MEPEPGPMASEGVLLTSEGAVAVNTPDKLVQESMNGPDEAEPFLVDFDLIDLDYAGLRMSGRQWRP